MASETHSTRERLIGAAARLFQERGYASTGLNDVLAAARAPKGSLYHHFPDGKEGLAVAAAALASERFLATICKDASDSGDATQMIARFASRLAGWLEQSGFKLGCPVATLTLEQAAVSDRLASTLSAAFSSWQDALAARLKADGISEHRSGELALLALCAIEGALVLARAKRSAAPVMEVAGTLGALFAREA
ncbi:MAG TPA: TetR/AcrR family transcriptional regulator [Oceanicaulis sp.]|jgi:TetR/AcrR family transcriptional repressor of lmrAB and yxaGH operons|uniref:TetR family transcriptional regulator n=1 Tax=Glycocaulis albus TaxID=1382801 RepID=A0ABQ1XZM0_9PROT|nr:TetR/AcrR family transcriptional regulator [Glycocaulis albus]MBV5261460.1 TetR/AcrR family transcriptional regulator [Synechococcus moorigangaii CMS01]GGH08083.1 TetR family transcriptional regulator [Glycocaulis albus]HCY56064.1 TetR/AcrR family transcriptional regulator [Oceanicaulis sp.]